MNFHFDLVMCIKYYLDCECCCDRNCIGIGQKPFGLTVTRMMYIHVIYVIASVWQRSQFLIFDGTFFLLLVVLFFLCPHKGEPKSCEINPICNLICADIFHGKTANERDGKIASQLPPLLLYMVHGYLYIYFACASDYGRPNERTFVKKEKRNMNFQSHIHIDLISKPHISRQFHQMCAREYIRAKSEKRKDIRKIWYQLKNHQFDRQDEKMSWTWTTKRYFVYKGTSEQLLAIAIASHKGRQVHYIM